jgi:hypothetical protein
MSILFDLLDTLFQPRIIVLACLLISHSEAVRCSFTIENEVHSCAIVKTCTKYLLTAD